MVCEPCRLAALDGRLPALRSPWPGVVEERVTLQMGIERATGEEAERESHSRAAHQRRVLVPCRHRRLRVQVVPVGAAAWRCGEAGPPVMSQ